MPAIDVVSDANIVLKWFHERDEQDVQQARTLLELHRARRVVLHVLDLTYYEVGNTLMRGRAQASPEQTAIVLKALRDICLTITPDDDDLALTTELVAEHNLTVYDAAYAAVARRRRALLVTLDQQLLIAGLGMSPDQLLNQLTEIDR